MKLYKYVPFNDGSLNILTHNTMKFSSYSEFNDPFDCVVNYDIEKSMEYVINERSDLLKAAGEHLKLSPAQRIQKKSVMLANIRRSMEQGAIAQDLASAWGICSLSDNPNSILMWSHYADLHRGFVVEFETDDRYLADYPERTLASWPVEYSESMPKTHMGVRGFDAVKKQFLVKATDWSYEREHRCLAHVAGPGIHKFRPEIMTGVIAGAKMQANNFDKLQDLVAHYNKVHNLNVSMHKMTMARDRYELVFV